MKFLSFDTTGMGDDQVTLIKETYEAHRPEKNVLSYLLKSIHKYLQ